jgi:hypothetical protein
MYCVTPGRAWRWARARHDSRQRCAAGSTRPVASGPRECDDLAAASRFTRPGDGQASSPLEAGPARMGILGRMTRRRRVSYQRGTRIGCGEIVRSHRPTHWLRWSLSGCAGQSIASLFWRGGHSGGHSGGGSLGDTCAASALRSPERLPAAGTVSYRAEHYSAGRSLTIYDTSSPGASIPPADCGVMHAQRALQCAHLHRVSMLRCERRPTRLHRPSGTRAQGT